MKSFADFGIDVHGKTSGECKVTCPRCSHTRKKKRYPCLNVSLDKGVWHCWHCEWAGSLQGGEDRRSSPPPRPYHKPAYRPTTLPENVMEWFKERGIPETVLARRQIGYGPVYMPHDEEEVPAIQFPFRRDGEVVNVKYRDAHKHFRMVGGAERILYGLDDLQGDTLLICEGEIDAMSLEVAGYPSVLSVPDGAPAVTAKNYESKFDFLRSAEAVLAPFTRIILAVDTDAPGQKLAEELARRLGPERCWRTTWSSECKDANDVLVSYGATVVKECIEASHPWPVRGIVTGDMLSEAIDLIYEKGMPLGTQTGWASMAKHYTVRTGEMTIVTGIPSHGKSQWVTALMVHLADRYGWRFAVFSPENYPLERYEARILEIYTGEPFDGAPDRMDRETLQDAKAWFNAHISFLMPEDESPTVDHLLTLARTQVTREGVQGVILDPWNEIEHSRPAALVETEYISKALSQIRRFARLHGVHVWVIAHPTKMQKAEKGPYAGTYPPPTPYDMSGSANWRNKADNCITIWRNVEGYDRRVEVHIQKIRFREIGTPGKVDLVYQPWCGRYTDAADAEAPPPGEFPHREDTDLGDDDRALAACRHEAQTLETSWDGSVRVRCRECMKILGVPGKW
jgi:twinkle protein